MTDVRCYYGDFSRMVYGGTDPQNCYLGVGWRDSNQMSFELPSLIDMYLANPSAFTQIKDPQARYVRARTGWSADPAAGPCSAGRARTSSAAPATIGSMAALIGTWWSAAGAT